MGAAGFVIAGFDFNGGARKRRFVFREIVNVRQERAAGRRRWFESEHLDLVVWFDRADHVIGFQLLYDLGEGEHALTWREGVGFVHSRVDLGDDGPFSNLTPILVANGRVPWPEVTQLFAPLGPSLDPELYRLVQDRLAKRV